VYSYPWRFDNFAEEFQRLGVAITAERLAQILKTVTGDNWTTYSYNYLGQGTLGTSATYFGGGVLCMEHDTTEDRVLHRGIF
ncbi:hypothetical protein, partial [Salmonella enterica]|uniref:hypothetical protein n=1 Tax=Salmonella enterica TaxID=28901 RepID=UPI0019310B92